MEEYPLSKAQQRLQEQLYGLNPIGPNEDTLNNEHGENTPHSTYMNNGYAGQGTALVGVDKRDFPNGWYRSSSSNSSGGRSWWHPPGPKAGGATRGARMAQTAETRHEEKMSH
jgi:hypothetical protein